MFGDIAVFSLVITTKCNAKLGGEVATFLSGQHVLSYEASSPYQ